jgi:hypothetical protein
LSDYNRNSSDAESPEVAPETAYERPALVAIGNLHDILAGDNGTQCDNVDGSVTTGHDTGPPFCE